MSEQFGICSSFYFLSPRLTGHACVERPGHAAGKFASVMCEQLGIDLLSHRLSDHARVERPGKVAVRQGTNARLIAQLAVESVVDVGSSFCFPFASLFPFFARRWVEGSFSEILLQNS